MAEKRCKITFEPEGQSVYVLSGTTLYEAAGEAGIIMKSECGGAGTCGNCKVIVISGKFEESGSDRFLTEKEMKAGTVLACRTKIKSDMMIEIPLSSSLFEQKILTEGRDTQIKLSPNVQKIYMTVEKPTLEDQRSDLDRIWDGLKNISSDPKVPIDILRRLPEKLRKENYSATIVLNADEIVGIESGDKSATNYGVAFDIGTTTVVGYLHELNTGKQLSVASRTNPQTSYGDDVITRINHTNTAKDGLNQLHVRIISCVNEIIDELADEAGIETKFIYEITTTGNTTMNHLFLKLNPKYIALNPYVGVLRSNIDVRAKEIGININRYGKVHSMPNIAGFVGGDTVAVILASEMHKSDKLQFAIDIGTNGELVMGNRDRLVACSTAAGPAFEGARITHGMRASDGAIEKVIITDKDVEINTIGNAKPIGMCGTALIDSIAELRKRNIITTTGKMLKRAEIPDTVPGFIRERVIDHDKYRTSFILVPGSESQTGDDILITQKDVRETQLAKGAIFAGYQILKSILSITDDDIQGVLLAGAFGNYIRKEQAKWTGLLPDIPSEKIQFIGNAAGTGAKMVLLSKELRAEAAEISRKTEYIELAVRLDFQKVFTDSMFYPECLTCE